jgi:hypothetical protein
MEGRLLTVKPRLYDAHHTVFVPMKMPPIELQQGFIDLVDRVLSYEQIKKRLLGAAAAQPNERMVMSQMKEMALYYKIAATLKLKGDHDGYRFVTDLQPHIRQGRLSMVSVLVQLDHHDFAVRNRLTLKEHRYNLDVPSWEERGPTVAHAAGSMAAEIAATVR